MFAKRNRPVATLPLLLAAVACGGGAAPFTGSLLPDNAPDWVASVGEAFDDGERAFYGVGVVTAVRNVGLARSSAANRARSELAASINVFVRSLYIDYQASITDLAADATAEEQLLEQAIDSYTEATLSGVRITEYWEDKSSGSLYALAKLDFENAASKFDRLNQLNEQAREYIRQNAERMFDKLDEAGRRQR